MIVRIRARARHDLDDILDYTMSIHGEAAAEAYLRTIAATLDRLAEFPELGVQHPDLLPRLRSIPVGEHRIFYVILTGRVSVARVLHKAMDPGRHI